MPKLCFTSLACVGILSLACIVACQPPPDAPPMEPMAPAPVAPWDDGDSSDPAAVNIVGDLSKWAGRGWDHSPGRTALDKANHERQLLYGMPPLKPDADLNRLTLKKATIAAAREFDGHVGGSLGGASCEGVGTSNGRFMSCCLEEPGTHAGAAMVQGKRAWYCCFLIR